MSKNNSENKEKKKDIFEEKLKEMARDGDLGFALEDIKPTTLTINEAHSFYNTVKKASLENKFRIARKALPEERLSFGRHLQWIRKKSRISKEDVAKVLRKDIDFINRLESGRINPLKILEDELIEIMQLFRIGISEFIQTIKAHYQISEVRTGKKYAMARSAFYLASEKKSEALSHAFDAVMQKIGEKENDIQDTLEIDEKYIEEIREELRRRGELELLE